MNASTSITPPKPESHNGINMPNVLFASDGRKFFPCKFCCRAFAYKSGLMSHVKSCPYQVHDVSDSETDDSESGKSFKKVKKERNSYRKKENGSKDEDNICELEFFINPVATRNESKNIQVWENLVLKTADTSREQTPETNNNIQKPHRIKVNENLDSKQQKILVDINREVTCNLCSETFKSAIDLLRHKRESHSGKKVMLSEESLKIYDKIYRTSGKNICPICEKPTKKSSWQTHLQTHSRHRKMMRFFCSVCKKGFNRIDHQREHEKRHVVGGGEG